MERNKRKIKAFIMYAPVIENGKAVLPTPDHEVKEIEDSLESFYKIIGCDCIDITSRSINGKVYNIICDDEGLLKNNSFVTLYNIKDQNYNLVGTTIYVGPVDEDGELTSLPQDYIDNLFKSIYVIGRTKRTSPEGTFIYPAIGTSDV